MNLGRHPLLDPDEGRNAEVGREMALTNDYVVPRLNGLPYLDKPILNFAAQAAFTELLGANEISARLPSLLWTLATIALIAWFARRELGGDADIVAAIALASCPLVIAFARIVIFDAATSLCIAVATIAFYIAIEERNRRAAVAGWIAIGFGILAKGPVALLLPLITALPYGLWRRGARRIWSVAGVLLMFAVIAPWIWGMTRAVPEFLEYSLVTETARRFATNELKRTGPFWYFLPLLLVGALPWILTLGGGLRRREVAASAQRPFVVFALLWLAVPLLFFSISQSKRPQYILPLMPPIALLVAWHFEQSRERLRGATVAVASYVAFAALLLVALFPLDLDAKLRPHLREPASRTAMLLASSMAVAAAISWGLRQRPLAQLATLAAPMLLIPVTTAPVLDAVASHRSARELASRMGTDDIVLVRAYSPSLVFYERRLPVVVTADAVELTSNYLIRSYQKWVRRPDSPFRPYEWVEGAVRRCARPMYFVTERKEKEAIELLRRYLPHADRNDDLEVFGPCRPPGAR